MNKAGWIAGIVVAVATGFFIRGMMPSVGAPAGAAAAFGAMPPPAVKVMTTALETASPVVEYIAHVEPIQQVRLMAQVEGTIQEVHFQEGVRVKRGDLLFTIDPEPYEAALAQRKAEKTQAMATLDRAEKYLGMLKAADNRSVSKSDLDAAEANVAEGRAMVNKADAAVRHAEINLGYTQITSPIDGRIGRALITRGNVVSPASGVLATVIQIDPIRVVFAMPDSEYLTAFDRYSSDSTYEPEVRVRLANGAILEDEGAVDFDDNQMNPATGTIDIRMRFPNAHRMLVPNNFVTVLVRDGNAPEKIVVPVEAVMHGTDGAYVWTVTPGQGAAQVRIVPGAVIGNRLVVESGLGAGVQVVVAGMQKLRPGMTVAPVEAAKPE